jgi:hypothetical protein
VTRHARLDGDTVTGDEVRDIGAYVDDDTGSFVAEDVVGRYYACTYLASLPKVKVGAANVLVMSLSEENEIGRG